MKRDRIEELKAWASFKLTRYTTRHLLRAKNVTAYIVKGHLHSLERLDEAEAKLLSLPYKEIVFWSDSEEVVSSILR